MTISRKEYCITIYLESLNIYATVKTLVLEVKASNIMWNLLCGDNIAYWKVTRTKPHFLAVEIKIIIASYGMSDLGFPGLNQAIQINGVYSEAKGRGFNIAVLSPTDGLTLGTGNFDTHAQVDANADMVNFIERFPDGSIICIAVTDSAAQFLSQDAKNYLGGLGSNGVASIRLRESLALLTAKGPTKPTWFVEKYANAGAGPSVIDATLRF